MRRPMLHQRWRDVSFIHWRYPPAALRALVPAGLELDTFDGFGWLSLTPQVIEETRPPIGPAVPLMSTFPETNLRTYVIGPDGRDGLWFFTLEAASMPIVAAARVLLGVPYRWSAMTVEAEPAGITYTSRRRFRSPAIGHRVVVQPRRVGGPSDQVLSDWLTGRWRAWTRIAGRFVAVPVQHEPWSLVDAVLIELEENLRAAIGLPASAEAPTVQFSTGVEARLGCPQLRRSHRARHRV